LWRSTSSFIVSRGDVSFFAAFERAARSEAVGLVTPAQEAIMNRRWSGVLVLAAFVLLAATPVVLAQATSGRISGIVKDSSGGVLPGVT
jgi:hypothetical protein